MEKFFPNKEGEFFRLKFFMLRGNGESFLTTLFSSVLPGAGSRGLEFKISIPKIHPMKQSKQK
jgi:hypothetical protein